MPRVGKSGLESEQPHFNRDEPQPQFNRKFTVISDQTPLSLQELLQADIMRGVEGSNIQLIEIQNKRKTLKTALDNCKHEVNAVLKNANHVQFTSSAAELFQQLNHAVSQ
ncbi:Hypothetical_protein [Hexamita inflata]|uniref:Hypothetical_protein n=1 Tax=Hexamita inflata TaxID=28002 RepID=A0AA86UT16_9EUKA|nr:Hypothetical protein HINF_LOCUS58170 [Hexamita inflata]